MQYEQQDKGENGSAKEAVRKLRSAQMDLQEALATVAEANPNLRRVALRGSASRPGFGLLTLGCIIVVIGDDQDEADRHCKEMADQGCSCQSTGPAECECDCGGV